MGHSPISRWVRPNLGDALMTVVVHCERHHRQIARVRAATGALKSSRSLPFHTPGPPR